MVIAQHLHERVIRRYTGDHALVESTFLHRLLSKGGMGVMIFFALSGFILYQLLSRPLLQGKPLNLRAYFWRRVTRLEPPYIVITTAIMLFVTTLGYNSGGSFLGKGGNSVIGSYLATVTYTHTLIYGRPPSFNPPGWSLETEVQFYILAPLLVVVLLRLSSAWFRLFVASLVTFSWPFAMAGLLSPEILDRFPTSVLHAFPYFMAGVLTCEWMRAVPSAPRWASWAFDVLAVASYLKLMNIVSFHLPLLRGMEEPLLLVLILLGAFRGNIIKSALSIPWVATIGGMCYTIYLVHLPVLELLCGVTVRRFVGWDYWSLLAVEAIIGLPAVLLVSGIAFLLLEQPCMRKDWPVKLWASIKRYRYSR